MAAHDWRESSSWLSEHVLAAALAARSSLSRTSLRALEDTPLALVVLQCGRTGTNGKCQLAFGARPGRSLGCDIQLLPHVSQGRSRSSSAALLDREENHVLLVTIDPQREYLRDKNEKG